ncbi:ornithine cyclodeaminase [Cryptosporangium japonicum]|uniref:Ornithine cyclodeaminase n=1 Tax=Cryptosporangium japonicum TaxID=80872 RepID=A0ABN0U1D9_9ACTN
MNVPFVDVASLARWVTALGAERIVADLVGELELDFKRWPEFDKSARVATHSTDGVIELMPISDGQQYAFKYVNGHPTNPEHGYQTVTAFGVLADVHNGYPVFAAEMTILTALRTAATSALAARYLARPGSTTMALIGCGAQAEFQALGFRAVLGIDRLRIWDTDPAAMDKFERNATALGFTVERASDAHDATVGADVVTTCTADKTNATVLAAASVGPGVHVNAIGGDCPGKTELDPDLLPRSEVFVEYTPQTRIEGEIQRQPAGFAVTELWEVIAGLRPGRSSAEAITVFDSVGFAIEDFTALRYLARSVEGTGYAVDLDLIADPRDPKDLFGFVAGA